MARPRRLPPSTPFGLWLDEWFRENASVTFEAFAQDVDTSKSAVSLWISAKKPIAIKPRTLRLIAARTGAALEDLERMAYGGAGERKPQPAGVYLSPEELETLLQRAAAAAVRQVLDEMAGARGE